MGEAKEQRWEEGVKDSQPERVTERHPERECVGECESSTGKLVCQSKSMIDSLGSSAPPEPTGPFCRDVGHRVMHMRT